MLQNLTTERLNKMVAEDIKKEEDYWRSLELSSKVESETDITYLQREETLGWLLNLNERFQFYPEAYALTVAILDKFLATVKARPRYLKCIGLTCFHLAAKITEEDEMVPCVSDLVSLSAAGCTGDDIIRMERIVLNKLSWNINLPTSLGFLQMFHASLMMICPTLLDSVDHMTPSGQLTILTQKLQEYTLTREACRTRPAVMSLSLLSLELEVFRSDWFPLTLSLLKYAKVSFSDLIRCREKLTLHRSTHQETVAHQRSKRKMEASVQSDDVYDSIKKLYNDENGMETYMENEC